MKNKETKNKPKCASEANEPILQSSDDPSVIGYAPKSIEVLTKCEFDKELKKWGVTSQIICDYEDKVKDQGSHYCLWDIHELDGFKVSSIYLDYSMLTFYPEKGIWKMDRTKYFKSYESAVKAVCLIHNEIENEIRKCLDNYYITRAKEKKAETSFILGLNGYGVHNL